MRAFINIIYLIALSLIFPLTAFSQVDFWQPTPGGPYGSSIYISLLLNRNGYLFAGTISNGGYRSLDNGNQWEPMNTYLTQSGIKLLASDQDCTIYADVGNPAFSGSLIMKSSDNGSTWDTVWVNQTINVTSIAIDSQGTVLAGTNSGLYRNWQPCGLIGLRISTIAVDSGGQVYAGTIQIGGTSTVYRLSSDCSSVLPVFWVTGYDINSLLYYNGKIYIASWNGIYMSTNNGINWDTIRTYGTQHLAINPKGHLFAADNGGISRTKNDGLSWDNVSNGLSSTFITSIAVDPDGFIFVGTRVGGVNRSINNGDSWIEVNYGLVNTAIDFLFVSKPNRIFANASYWGGGFSRVFKSTNLGITWSLLGSLDTIPLPVSQDREGNIYGRCSEGIYRSSDDGDNWVKLGLDTLLVWPIAVNDSNIFAGAYYPSPYYYNFAGLFRSSDHGNTWQYIGFKDTTISAIAFKPNGEIYLGRIGKIFRSTNNGQSWILYDFPHPVNTLFINPKGYLFVGSHNLIAPPYSDAGEVYRSTDDGLSWALVKTTGYNVMSFVSNSRGEIFASDAYSGVYHSTDDGETWSFLNDGLINTMVWPLALDSLGFLYAGTYGDGVFRSVQPTDDVKNNRDEMPSSFALLQNYPNPFNPVTIIQFDLPKASFVVLKVYNLLGQEVVTLVNEKQEAGIYQVTFSANELSSGIYYYRLQAGTFSDTKKLLLLR